MKVDQTGKGAQKPSFQVRWSGSQSSVFSTKSFFSILFLPPQSKVSLETIESVAGNAGFSNW